MNKVKFKMKTGGFWCALLLGFFTAQSVTGRSVTLSYERCSPYDTVFNLNYILIDSCSTVPCLIPIGQKVVITGSFTYTGANMENALKLRHSPNWLLNYVYTEATVVTNVNEFSASDQFDFQAIIYVDEGLAPLKGTLNYRLYDDEDNRIACYNIPIQLTLG